MSIESEDLDAAVAAGVLPQGQAEALRAFVAGRRRSQLDQAGREDERFRFMTGFNDFFFAIGILLLGFGIAFFTGGDPLPSLIAASIVWALSELLVRRMRLVLPGILLSLFFVFFVYLAVPFDLSSFRPAPILRGQGGASLVLSLLGLTGSPFAIAVKALIATGAAALYYWRFRLPFALLPIAASLVLAVVSLVMLATGPVPAAAQSLIILVCGWAVFAAAMTFDLSDRDRLTRRSDCAFWLHLLAAPLIVHSLISLVTPSVFLVTNNVAVAIVLIVAILAVVAIAIDRRALLVSALLYVGVVIAYAIGGPSGWPAGGAGQGTVFFSTLVVLGVFVITLGVGWMPLRRRLLAHISSSIAGRLPPVAKRV